MDKFLIFIFLITIVNIKLQSQNLVINSDFETHTGCGPAPEDAPPWYQTSTGNSDYLNACFPGLIYSVPRNAYGYQNARSGVGYCFIGISLFWFHTREYISTILSYPLIAGKKYYVKFYVSLTDTSEYGIDALGAYFSVGRIDTTGQGGYIVNFTPQISNRTNNIITDTAHWTAIFGSFIAHGGEDNMTIGCFVRDEDVNFITVGNHTIMAGYYIDDVSVYECDNPDYPAEAGNNKTICPGESVQLGTTNYEYYTYRWHPKLGLSDTASGTPWVKPMVTTTYYLKQFNFFDTLTTDSVTIYVNDCSGAEAGGNRTLCKGSRTQIGSNDYAYNRYSWHPAAGLSDTTSGTPWASPQVTTMYYLTQHNMQDSISHDSVLVKVIDCDSVNNNVITIYPNPSQGEFYIEFSSYVPEDARFTVSNTLGQILIKSDITREERKKLVNTGFLASGVYFCRVYAGENLMRSEKIVKVISDK